MKKIYSLLAICLFAVSLNAQQVDTLKVYQRGRNISRNKKVDTFSFDTTKLYTRGMALSKNKTADSFNVPNILDGTNFAPPQSADFSLTPTASLTTLKFSSKLLDKHFELVGEGDAKAVNGVSTLYTSTGPVPWVGSAKLGVYYLFGNKLKQWLGIGNSPSSIYWLSLVGTYSFNDYNIFSNNSSGQVITSTIKPSEPSIYLAFNRNTIKRKNILPKVITIKSKISNNKDSTVTKIKPHPYGHARGYIGSISIGYSCVDNYSTLAQRSLETLDSTVKPSNNQSVVNSVSGAVGDFQKFQYLPFSIEVYKPIYTRNTSNYTYYCGFQYIYYINTYNSSYSEQTGSNYMVGFFASGSGSKVSFSISYQKEQLNTLTASNSNLVHSIDQEGSLVITTLIPIKFLTRTVNTQPTSLTE